MQRYFLRALLIVASLSSSVVVSSSDTEETTSLAGKEKRYNVLSIGSQYYHAILTSQFLSYMEDKAYLIA